MRELETERRLEVEEKGEEEKKEQRSCCQAHICSLVRSYFHILNNSVKFDWVSAVVLRMFGIVME